VAYAQNRLAESVYDTRPSDYSFDVFPDERIGAAVGRASASRVAIRFVIAVALSGAWTAAVCTTGLGSMLSAAQPVVSVVIEKAQALAANVRAASQQQGAVGGISSDMASADTLAPGQAASELPPVVAALPMQDVTREPAAEQPTATSEPVGADYTDKVVEAEEPAEKKERRAQAASAGLSPDLPNVLLSRLSKEDFKNASYAIKTAIAKTPDDAKFIWPLAPSASQAKFEVHFVTGAESGCRRYVVTVTKDRWSSTAAALEKCGVSMARAS
jgi:hypothetical protein